jgi:hypothetical protein
MDIHSEDERGGGIAQIKTTEKKTWDSSNRGGITEAIF